MRKNSGEKNTNKTLGLFSTLAKYISVLLFINFSFATIYWNMGNSFMFSSAINDSVFVTARNKVFFNLCEMIFESTKTKITFNEEGLLNCKIQFTNEAYLENKRRIDFISLNNPRYQPETHKFFFSIAIRIEGSKDIYVEVVYLNMQPLQFQPGRNYPHYTLQLKTDKNMSKFIRALQSSLLEHRRHSSTLATKKWLEIMPLAKDGLPFIYVPMVLNSEEISTTQNLYNVSENIPENNSFVRSIYFSFSNFSSSGFGDIIPITTIARIMSIVQSTLGLIFFGIFVSHLYAIFMQMDEKKKR